MDLDDWMEYDYLLGDDEPQRVSGNTSRRPSGPPPDNGDGCLIACIILAFIAMLALIWG